MRYVRVAAVLAACAFAAPVLAAPTVYTYDVNATFYGAPFSTSGGTFTVSFDPTVSVSNQTAGVSVSGLAFPTTGTLRFAYSTLSDELVITDEPSANVYGSFVGTGYDTSASHFNFFINDATSANPTSTDLDFYDVATGNDYVSYRANVTVSSASAVPEPASWTMMIGGFGLLGAALRRRTRATARFA